MSPHLLDKEIEAPTAQASDKAVETLSDTLEISINLSVSGTGLKNTSDR